MVSRYIFINVLIFITLLSLDLFSSSFQKIDNYSFNIRHGNIYEAKRSYIGLKNLYLSSIIDSNKALEERALRALIAGGKRLKYSTKKYENSLHAKFSTPIALKKQKIKLKKNQKHIKKPKKIIKKRALNSLKKIKKFKNEIHLYFSKKIARKDINHFILKSKKPYRYIYDINAKYFNKSKIYKLLGNTTIKVALYKKSVTRVVVESKGIIKPKFYLSNNRLKIVINRSKQTVSKIKHHKKSQTVKSSKNKLLHSKPLIKRSNKIIVIDAGHGGKDSGAVGRGKKYEKNSVLSISKRVAKKLKALGYRVYLTRDKDKFIKLSKRTKYANRRKADIFISIHANSVGNKSRKNKVSGIETYFLSPARSARAKRVAAKENSNDIEAMNFQSKKTYLNVLNNQKIILSNKLAIDIQKNMLVSLKNRYKNVRDGGVREGPFWVLVGAQMPSVLIEVGFLSHPIEGKRLFSSKYQDIISSGIVNGVDSFFRKN